MKDPEFYTIEENWPQPEDDSCTLESEERSLKSSKKEKKLTSGRARKKLTESLASITAAAIAVVMLAGTLPDLKDSFDDFPMPPDFNIGEFCSICKQDDCPYYDNGMFGLRVSVAGNIAHVEGDDLYHMPGFVKPGMDYLENSGSIRTEDGQRIVLQVNTGNLFSSLDISSESILEENILMADPTTPACYGVFYEGEDMKSGERHFFFAAVVYATGGDLPAYDVDALREKMPYISFPMGEYTHLYQNIDGVPNAQLQFCSNLDISYMEYLMEECTATVIKDTELVYELGQTMTFSESENIHRIHGERVTSSNTVNHGFHSEKGEVYRFLDESFWQKDYRFDFFRNDTSYKIIFTATDWDMVFDTWQTLNDNAPELGHEVFYPVAKLNEISVNGITYICYVMYTSEPVDDVNGNQWLTYYYVPQQEPNIAIVDHVSISAEQLQYLLENGIQDDSYIVDAILAQISLR